MKNRACWLCLFSLSNFWDTYLDLFLLYNLKRFLVIDINPKSAHSLQSFFFFFFWAQSSVFSLLYYPKFLLINLCNLTSCEGKLSKKKNSELTFHQPWLVAILHPHNMANVKKWNSLLMNIEKNMHNNNCIFML